MSKRHRFKYNKKLEKEDIGLVTEEIEEYVDDMIQRVSFLS